MRVYVREGMPTLRQYVFIVLVMLVSAGCGSAPEINTPPASTAEVTPAVEATPMVETTPFVETLPTAEVTQPIEPAPTEESTQAIEPTPISEAETTPAGGAQAAPRQLIVDFTAEDLHQLALLDDTGLITPLLDIPSRDSRIQPCGAGTTLSNLQTTAWFVGSTVGSLYLMQGANPPVLIDDVEYLSCLGYGALQFAPNGSQFGYIDYPSSITGLEFTTGVLKLYDIASVQETTRFENVTAFALGDEQTIIVSLFANNRNEADEAAVSLWDGTASREIATLIPTGERCRFTSAAVASSPRGGVALVMGQRCPTGNTSTQWQFYTLDLRAGSATLVASNFQPGPFVPYARSNNVFFSSDGAFAFFTVPDGVTTSTGAVAAVDFNSMTISVPIQSQAVFPSYSTAANALPRFSPDGRWLALVVTSPNNDNQLVALDLTQPNTTPITISAGSRGDLISGMVFTPDSQQIIYVAGDTNGGDNTLLALNLAVGSERRIARGHFGSDLAVSPDGTEVVLLDWKRVETPREPMYADLVRVELATQALTTLLPGAQIVDGRVTNPQTAVPLMWR